MSAPNTTPAGSNVQNPDNPLSTTVSAAFTPDQISTFQFAVSCYHAHMLHSWHHFTLGLELPPTNYTVAPQIDSWSLKKLGGLLSCYARWYHVQRWKHGDGTPRTWWTDEVWFVQCVQVMCDVFLRPEEYEAWENAEVVEDVEWASEKLRMDLEVAYRELWRRTGSF
ncbi:hypothetical protein EDC01DRAFT_629780 [Geopyxis carbonaria]|nr:hypothetical protein EDC01DRAFT_629780 [Geopyxis carbonaria]